MKWLARTIERHGWKHWVWVLALTLLGVFLGHRADQAGFLINLRYQLHQRLTDVGSRELRVRHTSVVVITDEEYWRGELAGRRPIKRDYLARLLRAVNEANPAVIALDFDFSAPDPTSRVLPLDYRDETAVLVMAIRQVASRTPIVLAQTIGRNGQRYVLESDVHDGGEFCPKKVSESRVPNVFCGYIALPRDVRRLPPPLPVNGGLRLDSFAIAVARARNPASMEDARPIEVAYGSFIPYGRYEEDSAVVLANDVFSNPDTRQKLQHRAVLIGGKWHSLGYGRGQFADTHASPVGPIPGVLLHANYAEAILDGRTYRPIRPWIGFSLEIAVVLAAALVFVLDVTPGRKALALLLLVGGLAVLGYVLFQNFGRFFDTLIPLVMVAGHAVFEQVREWRREALGARAKAEHSDAPPMSGTSG